jgi:HlyD family secretion protein
LSAAVAAAEAAVTLAAAQVRRAKSELVFAEAELRRAEQLRQSDTISEQALEKARLDMETGRAAVASEQANLEFRRRELESAKARLIGPETATDYPDNPEDCCVRVMSPVNGRVLKIIHESEQRIGAGQPLLEIGDPRDLEIVAELLSTDAVKIAVGAQAHIESWGGEDVLNARVRRVEPAGFEEVSALGIEEQRVNTVLEFTDPADKWRQLGHDYRVFVRIVTWSSEAVLQVPISALFRQGEDWAVFVAADDTARLTFVEVDHRNSRTAQVVNGLAVGQRVVLHPSDRVADGVRVVERDGG